jgi:hypothetical protein
MNVPKADHNVATLSSPIPEVSRMMKIPGPRRGVVRGFGLAAALLMLSATAGERAEALSLINPGAAPAAKHVSDGVTTEVKGGHGGGGSRGGGGGGFRGGGGGFHGGGFRGGGAALHGGGFRGRGAVFRGGGFRAAHVYRGGGYRYGGYHHGGYRFAHRRHFHSRYYGYGPSYYYPRYCRVIWTYYGPRKICRYRPWYHHHWRHRGLRLPLYW